MKEINAIDISSLTLSYSYDIEPNLCPHCLNRITPLAEYAFHNYPSLEIIFRCPNEKCQKIFTSQYFHFNSDLVNESDYHYNSNLVEQHDETIFSDFINILSESFISKFKIAEMAEYKSYNYVATANYKEAFQNLVQDYLKIDNLYNQLYTKNKTIENYINKAINNKTLRELALNVVKIHDNTIKNVIKWNNKDVTNLKKIIQISVKEIESNSSNHIP